MLIMKVNEKNFNYVKRDLKNDKKETFSFLFIKFFIQYCLAKT